MAHVKNRTNHGKHPHDRRRGFIPALGGQRITYLIASATTALLYCSLLGLGLLAANDAVPYLLLAMAAHLTTVVIVYPWYRLVVFRAHGWSWLAGYLRFYAVGLGFLATSLVGLPVLVELFHLPVMAAQALLLVVSPTVSYAIHRAWTFRERANVQAR
ncbi:GtrA family protein [Streptosporangium sp. G11]|uniref:GtrA family protein n=1 Tax=Streptosporangium sp. G11 TaxID=3436926 RepID=UPI003EB761ED